MARDRVLLAVATLAAVLGSSCGGGGSGGSPPSSLSYPSPPVFVVNQAITPLVPTVSGTVNSYAVSPALPAGLAISSVSGVISGTPSAVSPQASYTVTASNADGQTTAAVSIVVNDVAPSISYESSYYSFTNGVAAQTITPNHSGGAVVSWSVKPALPPGLMFGSSDGTISGTPTASAAPAPYVISASNSGGQSTANLTLAVSAGPVLDLGHGADITMLRLSTTGIFSQDATGHWVLWDRATAQIVASGTVPVQLNNPPYPADLAGPTLAVATPTGIELRSSANGQLLSTVTTTFSWLALATDGSYVSAGNTTGLTAWSPAGQVLLSKSGDYSKAMAFAAPGRLTVALGAATSNAIETISLATGSSSIGATYLGQFTSWFADGARFLTVDVTNTIRIYSSDAVLQDTKALPPDYGSGMARGYLGVGNWFWTPGTLLNIYAVGASAQPAASYRLSKLVLQSGPTLAMLPGESAPVSVIDLSGATPVKVDYPAAPVQLSAYAATSSSNWFLGTDYGVLVDGTSLSGTPRYFGYGLVNSVAGGTNSFAVATAVGKILYFNTATNSLAGTIDLSSLKLAMSADGSILVAQEPGPESTAYQTLNETLNVYSLPSGSLTASYQFSTGLRDWSLTPPGTVLGEAFGDLTQRAISAATGATLWTAGAPPPTHPGLSYWSLLSPDGTLAAFGAEPEGAGTQPTTTIYHNGQMVTSLTGWAAGWVDNGRLLVGNFGGKYGPQYISSTIYDPTGFPLASPPFGALSFPGLFQVVTPRVATPDLLYSLYGNYIVSLSSGAKTWASGSPLSLQGPQLPHGAVAGGEVVFVSGNLVLAEPH
jgi:hypothetical protein